MSEIEKSCACCEHASETYDENYVLCDRRGVVSSVSCCRKFIYDPLKRKPRRPPAVVFEYVDLHKKS